MLFTCTTVPDPTEPQAETSRLHTSLHNFLHHFLYKFLHDFLKTSNMLGTNRKLEGEALIMVLVSRPDIWDELKLAQK